MTLGMVRFIAFTFALLFADIAWLALFGGSPLSMEVRVTVAAMIAVLFAIADLRKDIVK